MHIGNLPSKRSLAEWIEAFTTLSSLPNLIAKTIKQVSIITTLKLSTDYFLLTVSGLFSRFLTEANSAPPPHQTPDAFAWDTLKIAVYENGLLFSNRNEQIRDDPARTFATAHESTNLHGVHTASHISGITTNPAPSQIEPSMVELKAQASALSKKSHHPPRRGRSISRASGTHGRSDSKGRKK